MAPSSPCLAILLAGLCGIGLGDRLRELPQLHLTSDIAKRGAGVLEAPKLVKAPTLLGNAERRKSRRLITAAAFQEGDREAGLAGGAAEVRSVPAAGPKASAPAQQPSAAAALLETQEAFHRPSGGVMTMLAALAGPPGAAVVVPPQGAALTQPLTVNFEPVILADPSQVPEETDVEAPIMMDSEQLAAQEADDKMGQQTPSVEPEPLDRMGLLRSVLQGQLAVQVEDVLEETRQHVVFKAKHENFGPVAVQVVYTPTKAAESKASCRAASATAVSGTGVAHLYDSGMLKLESDEDVERAVYLITEGGMNLDTWLRRTRPDLPMKLLAAMQMLVGTIKHNKAGNHGKLLPYSFLFSSHKRGLDTVQARIGVTSMESRGLQASRMQNNQEMLKVFYRMFCGRDMDGAADLESCPVYKAFSQMEASSHAQTYREDHPVRINNSVRQAVAKAMYMLREGEDSYRVLKTLARVAPSVGVEPPAPPKRRLGQRLLRGCSRLWS